MRLKLAPIPRRPGLWVLLACAVFVLLGSLFIPYIGIEDDEALFAAPLYRGVPRDFRMRAFHRDIPLMVMDYVGALKSWIYAPIFRFWRPSPAAVRIPALLIGALTIWLFYRLLDRAAGRRAAIIGALLLATDSIFLLTTAFDWGPVAIQHLALVAGCLLVLASCEAGAFFAFGLGLWDKASFLWLLAGLAIAALAVSPKEIRGRLTARRVVLAIAGFALGAWPLLVFNARHDWRTFRSASFSTANLAEKMRMLDYTASGSGLFGYMVNGPPAPVQAPRTGLQRASVRISELAREPRRGWMGVALLVSLALIPFQRRRRPILFALVFMAAAWMQMALTRNAGAAVHHTVLLWPFPEFVLAIALARAWPRFPKLGRAAVVLLCATNLLVTNQYLSQLIRYGPTVTWTDAIYPLSDALAQTAPAEIYLMDWGMYNPLLLLNEGRPALRIGMDLDEIDNMLASPRAVFVAHTPGNEAFSGINERLEKAAAARGYRREALRTIADRHGRPVFTLYRFAR